MLLFYNISSHSIEHLNQPTIIAKSAPIDVFYQYPNPNEKIELFKFIDLIRSGVSPTRSRDKSDMIMALRNCLDAQYITSNLKHIDEKSTDHIKARLMEEEINLFRRFGVPGSNFLLNKHTKLQLAKQTIDLSTMVGRVIAREGSGTGTLIAIPNGAGHKWAILTCGHILDDIGLNKNESTVDGLTFHLEQQAGSIQLPVKDIKVFKRVGQSFEITDKDTPPFIIPENSVIFPNHIRALPRYDSNADLALCFFDDTHILAGTQTIADYLDIQFPIVTEPNLTADLLSFSIQKGTATVKNYILKFADNDPDPLVTDINARNKTEMYSLGYAAFDAGNLLPTLSGARNIDRKEIYTTVINNTAGQVTPYNFFHDIPTYSGMSGGPIFHINNATATVTIFGVILGHYDVDGHGIQNIAEKSRCEATFLKQSLLQ